MNVIIDLTTLQAKSDYSSTFEPAHQTANAEHVNAMKQAKKYKFAD